MSTENTIDEQSFEKQVATPLPVASDVEQESDRERSTIDGRPCAVLTLPKSGCKVYILEYFTRSESKVLNTTLLGGLELKAGMGVPYERSAKYSDQSWNIGVKKVVSADGNEIEYNEQWRESLQEMDSIVVDDYIQQELSSEAVKKKLQGLT